MAKKYRYGPVALCTQAVIFARVFWHLFIRTTVITVISVIMFLLIIMLI